MQLDVIIPTYNRQHLLPRTLRSLLDATVPAELEVQVTVVDNNSSDTTRQTVAHWQRLFPGNLHYLFEKRQGRSFALNAGIAATSGELIGMIDDDEEVDSNWFTVIANAFSGGGVDFIGGPYYPRWGAEPPDWLPREFSGVIGWIDCGQQICPYDKNFSGILMGGNAVITREVLRKVGPYATGLGRTAKRLLSYEDEEMYNRLLRAGARGFYRPDLIIYHYIPPERLTRRYFRRWCFWRGVSVGLFSKEQPSEGKSVGGVPRWLYGEALRGMLKKVGALLGKKGNAAQGFAGELAVWDLMGFYYGRHFYKPTS